MKAEYLIITGIKSFLAVQNFMMEIKPNHHAKAFVTCFVEKELPYDILNNQIISIFYQKKEEQILLYRGTVQRLEEIGHRLFRTQGN